VSLKSVMGDGGRGIEDSKEAPCGDNMAAPAWTAGRCTLYGAGGIETSTIRLDGFGCCGGFLGLGVSRCSCSEISSSDDTTIFLRATWRVGRRSGWNPNSSSVSETACGTDLCFPLVFLVFLLVEILLMVFTVTLPLETLLSWEMVRPLSSKTMMSTFTRGDGFFNLSGRCITAGDAVMLMDTEDRGGRGEAGDKPEAGLVGRLGDASRTFVAGFTVVAAEPSKIAAIKLRLSATFIDCFFLIGERTGDKRFFFCNPTTLGDNPFSLGISFSRFFILAATFFHGGGAGMSSKMLRISVESFVVPEDDGASITLLARFPYVLICFVRNPSIILIKAAVKTSTAAVESSTTRFGQMVESVHC